MVAEETGGIAVPGDTTVHKDCERAVQAALGAFGGLDILVCCAGAMFEGKVADLKKSEWDQIVAVNLTGTMLIARTAIPFLQKRPSGAIVLIASLASLVAPGNMAGYIASKTALIGLGRSMAVDYGPHIRVNTLCPGWVWTEMTDSEMEHYAKGKGIGKEQAVAHATRFLPLRRMALPQEIARCAEFLCSDDASFITGTVLVADGGSSAVDVGYVSLIY